MFSVLPKGWAGAFLYNPKAKEALDKFYAREDTLSLGICNGCQLMVELNLINPEHKHRSHLCHNTSKKFESTFLGLTIPQNDSVMFGSLSGDKLGIWVAHGEGRFYLPEPEDHYNIIAKYNYAEYPGNPNGSDYNVAGICSADGRHLAMMPHLGVPSSHGRTPGIQLIAATTRLLLGLRHLSMHVSGLKKEL